MAQLIVRNLKGVVARALQERAAKKGCSDEAFSRPRSRDRQVRL
jgi:plasmid stability protein